MALSDFDQYTKTDPGWFGNGGREKAMLQGAEYGAGAGLLGPLLAIPGALVGAGVGAATYKDVPKPQSGQSFDEWLAAVREVDPKKADEIMYKSRSDPDGFAEWSKQQGFYVDPAVEKQKADTAREAAIRAQLDHFAQWANRPVDQLVKDPDVQRLMQSAQTTTANNDRLRGIEGGLSNANTEKAAMDSALAIENQRKQMYLQAAGAQLQDVNEVDDRREQARQFDVTGYNNSLQKQYDQKHGLYQTIGAVGGGLVGAGIGAVAGGPMGAAAGAGVGSSIGGGLVGSFAGPAPTYQSSVPAGYGGGGYTPSGGLSGRNY